MVVRLDKGANDRGNNGTGNKRYGLHHGFIGTHRSDRLANRQDRGEVEKMIVRVNDLIVVLCAICIAGIVGLIGWIIWEAVKK